MMNVMRVRGYTAVIQYDPEIEMFRGEFVGLNGGADFYARDIESLKKEAEKSLETFLEACEERGIEPTKRYSGKFSLRIPPELHERIAVVAKAKGKSVNQVVKEALEKVLADDAA